jgi:LacI family transcriptional regulator
MKRRISSHDVAHHAGVSRATVSFVLNGRTDLRIAAETRERVLRAASELGYRPNGVARSLVRGKTQTIGVIVPRLDSSFTADIVNGIQEACAGRDYRVLLAYSLHAPDVEAKEAYVLLEQRVDGILCVAGHRTLDETHRWLAQALAEHVPCVLVKQHLPDLAVDYVVSDDDHGARAAVKHLLHLGHRRIGHLSAGTRASSARERDAGYRAALADAGVAVDESLIAGGSYRPESATAGMTTLLQLPEPPTAVFAANDSMAAAALEVATQRGLRVPEDVALVGYGDVSMARYLRLTTVHQPAKRMGLRAAERLFDRLEDPDLPPEGIVLPTRLVVRATCGAVT